MWKDTIRPASYKGAAFGVSAGEKEAGRRSVLHEFPQRDLPFCEDMGSVPQKFTLNAFVLGNDYMGKRDALEKVLQDPQPGTLVHPWYGEITVAQFAPYKVSHSAQDGGIAIFTLSFVQAEAPSSPSPVVNQKLRAQEKAGITGLLSCDAFDAAFEVVGQTAHVVGEAYSAISKAVSRVQAIMGGDIGVIADVLANLTGYDLRPAILTGQALWNVFSSIGTASGKTGQSLASAWVTVAAQTVPVPQAANVGSTRARIAANQSAVNAFVQRLAVVEASKTLASQNLQANSRKEAQILREQYMDAIDALLAPEGDPQAPEASAAEFLPPEPIPDALFAAILDTRAASLRVLAEAARSAPDVITHTPRVVLPSLTLVYSITGGVALEADFVARNNLSHPAFVPVQPLEVLRYE